MKRVAVPTLTAFPTQHNTPFFFSTHADDVGHAMFVGPTGAGKSIVATFLLSQFRKYEGGNIYIFDKDYTCYIPTLLMNGQHLDLTAAEARGRMNPYALLGVRESDGKLTHFEYLNRFTRYLLESLSPDAPLSALTDDFAEIEQAIVLTAAMEPELHCLSTVVSQLRPELKSRASPWLRGAEKGHYFDNDHDEFSLGRFTTIEMGALLERDGVTAMAVLDYTVYRITMALSDNNGAPTVIYIEEVWFMLKNPAFESIIENWLRVLRKKNAVLWFATQSLTELANSTISAAIVNSIPTRVFLPNEEVRSEANYRLYTASFGLNDAQVEQIQRGIRKTNYLLVQGGFSRMVWARFDPTILACLRSDALAKKIFAKWYAQASAEPHWKRHYIEELTHVT